MPEIFSVSQLNAFLACPRKYRYRYVDRREPERKSAALAFGAAMHGAIEWYWRERIEGRVPALSDAQRMFGVEWAAQVSGGDLDFDDRDPSGMKATGGQLLALFLAGLGDQVPTDVEAKFEVEIHDPTTGEVHPTPLVGYVDFVAPGIVGELKTASRRTDPSMWDLQLSAYSFAMRRKTGLPHKVRVVELVTTKVPKIEVHEVVKTVVDEDWFLEVAIRALQSIALGSDHPVPGWMCLRCEYAHACRKR